MLIIFPKPRFVSFDDMDTYFISDAFYPEEFILLFCNVLLFQSLIITIWIYLHLLNRIMFLVDWSAVLNVWHYFTVTPNCVIIEMNLIINIAFPYDLGNLAFVIFVFCNLSLFLKTEGVFVLIEGLFENCVFFTGNGYHWHLQLPK